MYFILYLVIICVLYIKTFKENFTTEKIEKVTPPLILVTILVIILCILSALLHRG